MARYQTGTEPKQNTTMHEPCINFLERNEAVYTNSFLFTLSYNWLFYEII